MMFLFKVETDIIGMQYIWQDHPTDPHDLVDVTLKCHENKIILERVATRGIFPIQ